MATLYTNISGTNPSPIVSNMEYTVTFETSATEIPASNATDLNSLSYLMLGGGLTGLALVYMDPQTQGQPNIIINESSISLPEQIGESVSGTLSALNESNSNDEPDEPIIGPSEPIVS